MIASLDHTAAFANWWASSFPGTPCPPVPKRPDELGLTARLALSSENPALYQNLFGNSGQGAGAMPADTITRRANGQLEARDIPHLRAAGLEFEAQQLEQAVQRQMDQRLVDQTLASRQAAEAEMERSAQWAGASMMERLAMSGGPSAQAVAHARQMWGITGQ
jgi:hypothetical protein